MMKIRKFEKLNKHYQNLIAIAAIYYSHIITRHLCFSNLRLASTGGELIASYPTI